MNQILITEKLYITPELKRKRKVYKGYFFLSVFLICILISLGIYAEYDRGKKEENSQEILGAFNSEIQDTTIAKDNILIVVLDDPEQTEEIQKQEEQKKQENKSEPKKVKAEAKQNTEGYSYKTIANINIPKIDVNYAITDGETHTREETASLLKESPTKFWGGEPNEVGNFCIAGHNYRNTRFFSKVPTLEKGDIIELTDSKGRTLKYSVYDKFEVAEDDLNCTSQLTNGRTELTLITCTNDSKARVIVKAKAI